MRKFLFFLLSFCLTTVVAWSQQTVVKGKVTDAKSGEAIPYASVFFKGTTVGVTTDFDGFYKLSTTQRVDTLSVSYVGYMSRSKAIKRGITQTLNVQLESNNFELEEVVVRPGVNPAIRILKEAQKNKDKHNLDNLKAYQCESFNKIEIAVDNISEKLRQRRIMRPLTSIFDSLNVRSGEDGKPVLPIFISEALSDFYVLNQPQKRSEYIKATKISGVGVEDGSLVSQLLGSSFQLYNFYDNWNRILEKDFVSPIANAGTSYYVYTLKDSMFIDEFWCYEIQIVPKRKEDLAFNGTIWITDTTFALKRVSLEVSKDANLNFIEKLKIQQELIPTEGDAWVPSKTRVVIDISQLTENSAGMIAKFYNSNRNYVVNDPKPLKFYNDPIIVAEDAQMFTSDEFWNEQRHEQLTEEEIEVYKMVDSIKNIPKLKTYIEYADIIVNGYKTFGSFDIGPYVFLYSNNPVEGSRFRLGFKTNVNFSRKWILRGYGAYGFRDQRFKYSLQAERILSRKPWTIVGARHRDDLEPMGLFDQEGVSGDNLFSAISVSTAIDRFNRSQLNSFWFSSEVRKGLTPRIQFTHKTFSPVGNYVFAYYTDPERAPDSRLRTTYSTAALTFQLRYAPREVFLQNDNDRISLGNKNAPAITVSYTHGFKDLFGGDFEYNKLSFLIKQKVNTGKLGNGRYTLTATKYFDALPYPSLDILRGNESIIFNSNTYNLMNFFEFVSDEFVTLGYEQHFEGTILNRIPAIRKLKWRLVVSGRAIYGTLSQENRDLIPDTDNQGRTVTRFNWLREDPYAEVSYGIENIFKLLRVDAIHRLTYLDNPNVSPFGVKLSFQFTF